MADDAAAGEIDAADILDLTRDAGFQHLIVATLGGGRVVAGDDLHVGRQHFRHLGPGTIIGRRGLQRHISHGGRHAYPVEQPVIIVLEDVGALIHPVRRALDMQITLDLGPAGARRQDQNRSDEGNKGQ